jgi:hypothetical protein
MEWIYENPEICPAIFPAMVDRLIPSAPHRVLSTCIDIPEIAPDYGLTSRIMVR